nr:hypothetical protein [Desulfobulbaceae bacterium]
MTNCKNFSPKQQLLYAKYQALTRFAKVVMQLSAIISEPTTVSSLLRCLYRCSIDTGVNRQNFSREIHKSIELLISTELLNSKHECNTSMVEIICREAVHENFFKALSAAVKQEFIDTITNEPIKSSSPDSISRELRIDLYNSDIDSFHKHLIGYYQKNPSEEHPIAAICNNPFSDTWFATLPDHVQLLALNEILKDAINQLKPIHDVLAYLKTPSPTGAPAPISRHSSFSYLYISALLFQGESDDASKFLADIAEHGQAFGLDGWIKFIQGDINGARTSFETDIAALKTANNNQQAYFTGFEGVIYCFAHLHDAKEFRLNFLRELQISLDHLQPGNNFRHTYDTIYQIADLQESPSEHFTVFSDAFTDPTSIDCLVTALGSFWIESRLSPALQIKAANFFEAAQKSGFKWIAREFAEILYRTTREPQYKNFLSDFNATHKGQPLVDSISYELPWKRALKNLQKLSLTHNRSLPVKQTRLVWYLRTNSDQITEIIPKLQKINLDGQWSVGRSIALHKLSVLHETTFLTDQDKQICATLKHVKDSKHGLTYSFDLEQALIALIDHPLAYHLAPYPVQVEVIKRQPDLHIQQDRDFINIFFLPFPEENQRVVTHFETRNRLGIYSITPEIRKISEIVGSFGLHAPANEKNSFLQVLGSLANHCNIHTNFDAASLSLESIEADQRIYCQLSPSGAGFNVSLLCKPYTDGNRYFKPGDGAQVIISKLDGKTIQIIRNLKLEEKNALLVEQSCPSLQDNEVGEWEWSLQSLTDCLQLLEELELLTDKIVVEWPKGKRLKIIQSVHANQLMLKINKRRNWFEISGDLTIDEDTVLSLNDLLARIRQSKSNFIPLSENNYIALSSELKSHLQKISSIAWNDNDTLRFSPVAAMLLHNSDFPEDTLIADNHWHDLKSKIAECNDTIAQLPSTINTTLRTYQKTGFEWLSKLAYLGFGACLADEMGLGKTIQALSFILDQAPNGPCLVIAPTSVCFNWIDEASKFTPTLNTVTLPSFGREKTVRKLKSYDVLITSYGLLQQEQELLSEVQWQVIALDEAQAIKNMTTKRFKAALSLNGKHRVVTSGTPLENNLGELWSIFRFINPGLLGSISQFNKRFAGPIEKNSDLHAQKQLKKIVSPFILRRLKTQVLEELPSRTEVNLQVQLSEEEKTLYESYRREAVENLTNDTSPNGHRHIKILAEIMKLRRLCCNPNLIAPELKLNSSKLTVFDSILTDLLSGGHKVLVFSQFVDHLKILRKYIESRNIHYQYLDGSTSTAQRRVCVKAFQAGEGDVFLISLRAGGLGLNLTAANYVIHMDPWWNPAVEDQASDRVHRIGQKLPVTIYRLITQNTIEEKIVELHQHKRELAENLLKGTELSNKISSDELIKILSHETI